MGIIQTIKNRFVGKGIADIYQTLTAQGVPNPLNTRDNAKRGMQVYTVSQLTGMTGRTKDGLLVTDTAEQPFFYLNLDEREGIFRLCSPVHAVVTGRMNKIAGLNWTVTSDREKEDETAHHLKSMKQLYDEYRNATDIKYQTARFTLSQKIKETLPDVLPDLSNFNSSMLRWKKRIDHQLSDKADQVMEWLREPNINDKWEDFAKKYVYDLLVHGAASIYKETINGRLENFYLLSGGTVIPMRDAYVGGKSSYVQVSQGMEPQIYYSDELSYSQYIPSTGKISGFIPLEALINKIAESMLFDKLMAEQADGTKPPEKMVIVTENSPFGSMDKEFSIPLDVDKQKRIETKLNQPKKGAVMTFSGNNVSVVDLTRENTMSIQMQRQKDIREEVALVFQASNMEMNLTGSDDTSGRSTSEAQASIMNSKAIAPIIRQLETKLNRDIIPFRFGFGYTFKFDSGENEAEKVDLLVKKMQTGLYSVNEIRSDELNLDAFEGEEYEKPQAVKPPSQGSEQNPLITKPIGGQ